jgi:anti-sigma28 factor (negative regulator of flagellin synthesis)
MIVNNNNTPGISGLNLEQTSLSRTQGATQTPSAGESTFAPASNTPGDDSISLSNTPDLIQQALNSQSSSRASRVQELQALIQNNQYQPDSLEVSTALINAHLTEG